MNTKKTGKSNIFSKEKSAAGTAIIASLSYLVLGLFMMLFSSSISTALCVALGIVLTVYGLFNIISFFINKEMNLYTELVVGIIATAFGIFALFTPDIIIDIIYITLGIIIIIDSLMDIKHSFQLKAFGMKKWWICTALSLLVIILGCFTIFFPDFFKGFLIFLLGAVLVYEGISGLVIVWLFGRYAKKMTSENMIDTSARDVE